METQAHYDLGQGELSLGHQCRIEERHQCGIDVRKQRRFSLALKVHK
ncbi:hypothetical protein [Streptomyces sp. NPDC002722]